MRERLQMFVRNKPYLIIKHLVFNKKSYGSELAKVTDCTYSHVVKLLQEFKIIGLVNIKRDGRKNFVTFTKQGEIFALQIVKAISLLEDLKK